MAKAYSSRKRPPRRARIDTPTSEPQIVRGPIDPLGVVEILGRFSEGLAFVEAACCAFRAASDDEAIISASVVTLQRGIAELQAAYIDLDIAIASQQP